MTRIKQYYQKAHEAVLVIFGATGLLTVLLAYQILVWTFAKQTIISCHNPKPITTQTKYCAYHTTSGLLSSTHTLLIGPSQNMGLVYTMPYEVQDITIEWNKDNDAVTIHMPGTELTIRPEEYVDSR